MPAKNTPGKFGALKFQPMNRKLWRRFVKEEGIEIDYKTFCKIITTTCKSISNSIINEPEGVQLPEGLGCIVITKYKPKAEGKMKIIDFKNTRKLGKTIPLLNLHSFGYIHHIKWYKIGTRVRNINAFSIYKCRPLKRGLAKSIKAGTKFFQWSASDLWNITKLERRFNKNYKSE